jgi:quercetin dioxygenase-like cupin family protein
MKRLSFALAITFTVMFLSVRSFAQDATVVDPEHYKVEFENDQVRVLRITYGPMEKSEMHSHPEGVAVFLTDGNVRFTLPDGKTQDVTVEAGQVIWSPETAHQPENTGKESFEVIQIEFKNKNE